MTTKAEETKATKDTKSDDKDPAVAEAEAQAELAEAKKNDPEERHVNAHPGDGEQLGPDLTHVDKDGNVVINDGVLAED